MDRGNQSGSNKNSGSKDPPRTEPRSGTKPTQPSSTTTSIQDKHPILAAALAGARKY